MTHMTPFRWIALFGWSDLHDRISFRKSSLFDIYLLHLIIYLACLYKINSCFHNIMQTVCTLQTCSFHLL